MTPRWRRARRGDRGATVVEFAMAFPVFLLVVLGLITTATVIDRQMQVNHAARDGARFGASLDAQANWADAVRARVVGAAAGGFTSTDVCVALVKGTGNSPTLVTGGSQLDLSARVVVRVRATGRIDWVVGSSTPTWTSTSTALWEPAAKYTGAGGITGAFSGASTDGTTCTGTSGDNGYAYVPGVTACDPGPFTYPIAPGSFTRSGGSGGAGTQLTQTVQQTACSSAVALTWAVVSTQSQGTVPSENLSVVSNSGTAPSNWKVGHAGAWATATPLWSAGERAVLTSNLEQQCSILDPCNDGVRGSVVETLTFSHAVTNLQFDLVHLEHDQSKSFLGVCAAWRYESAYLASNAAGTPLAGVTATVSKSANAPGSSQGAGTKASPWTANTDPSAFFPTCNNSWSVSVHVTIASVGASTPIYLVVQDGSGKDNNVAGWLNNPTNGTVNLQAGVANMSFTA